MLFLRGGDVYPKRNSQGNGQVKSKDSRCHRRSSLIIGKRSHSFFRSRTILCHGIACHCPEIDPYLNVDAGTMSQIVHGDVFVLDDRSEMDLDLGNYERFLSVSLTRQSNLSTRQVSNVLHESWNMLPCITRHASVSPNLVLRMYLLNVFE